MEYFESPMTNEQLDGLCPEGTHQAQVVKVREDVANDKADGHEYRYLSIGWRVVSGEHSGCAIDQFLNFDHPDRIPNLVLMRRRRTLEALGVNCTPGQKITLDVQGFVGKFAEITVGHWTNKNGKLTAGINDANGCPQPAQQPAQQAEQPTSQVVEDDIPF